MKIALLALFLFMTAPTNAQEVICTWKDAPEVRGLKLGKDASQVQSKLRGLAIPAADANGLAAVDFFVPDRSDESMRGVDQLGLTFLDNRLVAFAITYDGGVVWRNSDELRDRISDTLGLPQAWSVDTDLMPPYTRHTLTCDGFSVQVGVAAGRGHLTMTDTTYTETLRRRKKDEMQKRRDAFKP